MSELRVRSSVSTATLRQSTKLPMKSKHWAKHPPSSNADV